MIQNNDNDSLKIFAIKFHIILNEIKWNSALFTAIRRIIASKKWKRILKKKKNQSNEDTEKAFHVH